MVVGDSPATDDVAMMEELNDIELTMRALERRALVLRNKLAGHEGPRTWLTTGGTPKRQAQMPR